MFYVIFVVFLQRSRSSIHDVGIDQCFRSFTQEETLDGDEKPVSCCVLSFVLLCLLISRD